MRVPPEAYARLESLSTIFKWIIPEENAAVYPFPATAHVEETDVPGAALKRWQATVLYLSPMLERRAFGFIVACVAHELAHLALGHSLRTESKEEYDQQERGA